jgi:hypothetical protein
LGHVTALFTSGPRAYIAQGWVLLFSVTAVNPCQNHRFSGLERLELASLSQKIGSRKVETTASLKRHHSKAVGSFEDLDSGTTMQWEAFQRLPSVWG